MRSSLSLSSKFPSLHLSRRISATRCSIMAFNSLLWFRKGLRIHDNPSLEYACKDSDNLYPVFIIDPHFLEPDPTAFSPGSTRAGLNRIQFMIESLVDLDSSFRKLGSRLLVFHGEPFDVLVRLSKEWNVKRLCFEYGTEPYYQALDNQLKDYASTAGIEVYSPVSHTLFNPADIIQKNGGKPPLSYQSFLKLAGNPSLPLATTVSSLPPVGNIGDYESLRVPTIKELGYEDVTQEEFSPFRGGESEALKRLKESLNEEKWVANFEKPKTDPSAFLKPSTTVLSPYLKFGCLSSRYFYQCLQEVYKNAKKHSSPPVSLVGQLLWREFFYTAAFGTPKFDHMKGNRICKQIPWNDDNELLVAWREARTGYPWIDAIMVQLRKWGWIHHLARHSVACFLTRGDLFIHWERGRDVFERLLIDSDWAINNGNWLWLSCSSFFYQYNRVYSPISFGKKYDPKGNYIRHFLPALKDMPAEFIYEPWTAPLAVQTKANCIIGRDYPKPGQLSKHDHLTWVVLAYYALTREAKSLGFLIELEEDPGGRLRLLNYALTPFLVSVVDHAFASKECKRKMGEAYALNRTTDGLVSDKQLKGVRRKLMEDQQGTSKSQKQKLITDWTR